MTAFKAIGPFGIFRQEDILRAIPAESSEINVEIAHIPKSHVEDFKFNIVQTTSIQVELIVKSYDDVATHEKFIDTTNSRVTQRRITLDEEQALAFFGMDKESAPPKETATQKITKERAAGINVRIWIKRHKDFLRARAEFDEANAAFNVPTTDPTYGEEYAKVLKKQPSEQVSNDFATYAPRIVAAMSERLKAFAESDEDYADNLESQWDKADGEDPVLEARTELLNEYMVNMFSSVKA